MSRLMSQISKEIRLAGIEMPGRKDEAIWEKAKKAAHHQYPEWTEDNDRFWKVVQTIYENMGGT